MDGNFAAEDTVNWCIVCFDYFAYSAAFGCVDYEMAVEFVDYAECSADYAECSVDCVGYFVDCVDYFDYFDDFAGCSVFVVDIAFVVDIVFVDQLWLANNFQNLRKLKV